MIPAAGAPLHRTDIFANQSLMSKRDIFFFRQKTILCTPTLGRSLHENEMKFEKCNELITDEVSSKMKLIFLQWMRGSFKKCHQKRNRCLEWTFTDKTFLLGSDKEVDNNIKYSTYHSEWFIQPLNIYHTSRHVGDVITWTVNIDYLTSLIYSDVQ